MANETNPNEPMTAPVGRIKELDDRRREEEQRRPDPRARWRNLDGPGPVGRMRPPGNRG